MSEPEGKCTESFITIRSRTAQSPSGAMETRGRPGTTSRTRTGVANNLYYEDNVFTGNSVFHYGGQGGRYVARYNTYNFTAGGFQVVWDVHGNQPGGIYATMGAEIYGNTVTLDRSTACVDLRGGTAVIFDNTVTGPACSWQIREEYDDSISPTSNSQPATRLEFILLEQ